MSDVKDVIDYEAFSKLDIRVGKVIFCENVPKSEKLLKLEVDFGNIGKRQILTGLAKWYKPEDLNNKVMLFLVNLAPRKMMGLESQGMLLSVGTDNNEKPSLIFLDEDIPTGQGVC